MSKLKVFLVDDHEIARAGIRALIEDDVDIVGEADDPRAGAEMILERSPDVVLCDVQMPGGGGAFVIEKVKAANPDIAFLALSASARPEDVIRVLRAGAQGYVTKNDADRERLLVAIKSVAGGNPFFSPELAGFLAQAFDTVEVGDIDPVVDLLTPREREVLIETAKGYTNPEIGETLGCSSKTVETHVSSVLRKLQLTNRREIIRWATERGL
jgi:DNA-binding NarL/FixJ family response regulator